MRRPSGRRPPCRHRPSPAQDVAGPRPALHERQDQQHAHRQVLQRVGQPADDGVDHRDAGARRVEPSQHDGERHQQDQDDHAREAHRREVLQVPDPHLPRLVERDERERDGAEGGHDVDLYGARPAHDERHHVGDDDDDPAHERDDEHRQERRHVVVGRRDGHLRQVELGSRPEKPGHAVDGELDHLVDRLHEVEAVLYQEQEDREEHEHEHDLLDAGHARVAVHALGDLDELDGEHQREHAAPDGQDRRLPHAPDEVVHRHVAGAAEHLGEVRREHAVRPDGAEHVGLPGEDPVARVAQDPAQPRVDVLRDAGERGLGERERESERDGGGAERGDEPVA